MICQVFGDLSSLWIKVTTFYERHLIEIDFDYSMSCDSLKLSFAGGYQKHPLLILGPTLSRYYNAIVGTILQNPRFATLGA